MSSAPMKPPTCGAWMLRPAGRSASSRTRPTPAIRPTARGARSWVTNDHVQDICPVWSPSGFLYFSSYRSGGLNIWRIPVTARGEPSGVLQQLTTGAGQDVEAAVSRDGKRLAFTILRQNAD